MKSVIFLLIALVAVVYSFDLSTVSKEAEAGNCLDVQIACLASGASCKSASAGCNVIGSSNTACTDGTCGPEASSGTCIGGPLTTDAHTCGFASVGSNCKSSADCPFQTLDTAGACTANKCVAPTHYAQIADTCTTDTDCAGQRTVGTNYVTCDATTKKCVGQSADGVCATSGDCSIGHYCAAATLKCTAQVAEGAACTSILMCPTNNYCQMASSTATTGLCKQWGTVANAGYCTGDNDCLSGSVCQSIAGVTATCIPFVEIADTKIVCGSIGDASCTTMMSCQCDFETKTSICKNTYSGAYECQSDAQSYFDCIKDEGCDRSSNEEASYACASACSSKAESYGCCSTGASNVAAVDAWVVCDYSAYADDKCDSASIASVSAIFVAAFALFSLF